MLVKSRSGVNARKSGTIIREEYSKDVKSAEGRFFAPIGDAHISAVDVRDTAQVAAVALTEPGQIGQTTIITGRAAVSQAEIADPIAEAIGRKVTFVDVAPEAFSDRLKKVPRLSAPPFKFANQTSMS